MAEPGSPLRWLDPRRLQPKNAVIALGVAGAVALTGLVTLDLWTQYRQAVQHASSTTANLARLLEEHARQSLGRVELSMGRAADEIVGAGDLARTDPTAMRRRLGTYLTMDGLVRAFSIVDRDGAVLLTTLGPTSSTLSVADRDYFKAQLNRSDLPIAVGAPINSRVDGKWVIPVSRRIDSANGQFRGVLVATVDSTYFQRFYDSIDTGERGFVTLFQRQAWVVARSPADPAVLSRNWADSPMFREHLPAAPTQTVRQVVVADGVERIYSYRALKEYPVVVAIGLSLDGVLVPWWASVRRDSAILLLSLAGLLAATRGLVRQLRQRELAEISLRRLADIIESTNDIVATARLDGQLVYMNRSGRRAGGIGANEDIGRYRTQQFYPPERWDFVERVARPEALQHGVWSGQNRLRGPDGREIDVLQVLIAHRDEDGNPESFTGISRDISEIKQAMDAVHRQSERLKIAQKAAKMIVLDWYIAEDRLEFSDSPEWLRGPLPDDTGKYPLFKDQVHPEDRAMFLAARSRAIETLEGQNPEFRLVRTDGVVLWLRSHQIVGAHAQGRATHLIAALCDITEQKRTEAQLVALTAELEAKVAARTAELARALEKATAADRMKSDFLASVTHELRTPLNAVIGFTELLEAQVAGPLTPKQAQFAADILAGGRHLLALVERILELSRLDGAVAALKREPVPVGTTLAERLAARQGVAQARRLSLQLDVAPDVGSVALDPRALRRMVDALLDNAIEFNREGGTVGVSAWRDGSELLIAVADTGVGIAPSDRARLFQPLAQLDTGLARQHGGLGLGLALVRRLAELHGGSIEVDSEPGKGSRFTLRLPVPGWAPGQQAA
jgi:two-component system sensor histidine kinase/response regulator